METKYYVVISGQSSYAATMFVEFVFDNFVAASEFADTVKEHVHKVEDREYGRMQVESVKIKMEPIKIEIGKEEE